MDMMTTIPRKCLAPWPELNPRTYFDKTALAELAGSLKVDGIQEPILVVPCPEGLFIHEANRAGGKKTYVTGLTTHLIYAGERRWRAAELAGLEELPCIVREIDYATALRIALVENIQRKDLGVIEEARGLDNYLKACPDLTQAELGATLGYGQAWVANRIRLLQLPAEVLDLVDSGTITPTAARDHFLPFVKLRDESTRKKLFAEVVKTLKADERLPVPDEEVLDAVINEARELSRPVRKGHDYDGSKTVQVFLEAKNHKDCECGGPSLAWEYGGKSVRCFDLKWWKKANDEAGKAARDLEAKEKAKKPKGAEKAIDDFDAPKIDGFTWEDRSKPVPRKTVEKRNLNAESLLLYYGDDLIETAEDIFAGGLFDPRQLPVDKVLKLETYTKGRFDVVCLDAEAIQSAKDTASLELIERTRGARAERGRREMEEAERQGHHVGWALPYLLASDHRLERTSVERVVGDLYPDRDQTGGVVDGLTEDQLAWVAVVVAQRLEAKRDLGWSDPIEKEAKRLLAEEYAAYFDQIVPGGLPKPVAEDEGELAGVGAAEDEDGQDD